MRTYLLSIPPGGLAGLVGPVVICSHTSESHSPSSGGEWGWERPPSDLRIYSPETRRFIRRFIRGPGSLPARASGASDPCGKASNQLVAGGGATSDASDGALLPAVERLSGHSSLTALTSSLHGVGVAADLRRGEGGMRRPRDAGDDHNCA